MLDDSAVAKFQQEYRLDDAVVASGNPLESRCDEWALPCRDVIFGAYCLFLARKLGYPGYTLGYAANGRLWSVAVDVDAASTALAALRAALDSREAALRVTPEESAGRAGGSHAGLFGAADATGVIENALVPGHVALTLEDDESGTVLRYACRSEAFTPAELDVHHRQFVTLLADLVANPDKPVCDLEMVSQWERDLIASVNDTDTPFSSDACIHELFEGVAARLPDAPALRFGGVEMTYADLNNRANRLAATLRDGGVGPDTFVAIAAGRGFELIVAMFAVLKTGAAYVPLPPEYPPAYLGMVLAHSRPAVVLTSVPQVIGIIAPEGTRVVDLSDLLAVNAAVCPNLARPDGLTPASPAALIYTSGTTGTPKGVIVRHDTVVNYCEFNLREFGIDDHDRIMQFAPFGFSTAILEIVTTLIGGAKLCLVPDGTVADPRAFYIAMIGAGANILLAPPEYVGYLPIPAGMRIIETGASECRPEISAKIVHSTRHVNAYGLTEGSVPTVWHGCDGPRPKRIPIGRPVANTQVHILDADGRECGLYVAGELTVTGLAVSDGYLNDPVRTGQRFVPNPFGPGRMLRTGDIAWWNADGDVEYLGRVDNQVQVRGMRVELEEVERALTGLPGVGGATAITRAAPNGETQIVAFVTPAPGSDAAAAPDPAELRAALYDRLLEHKVPSVIHVLAQLPLTPNGKADKRALAQLELGASTAEEPLGPDEESVAQAFQETLGVATVGRHDDFFALGGHSLRAAYALNRLEELTGVRLPLTQIFATPTVAGLAGALQAAAASAFEPIPQAADQAAYVMSAAQRRIYLTCSLSDVGTAYNIPVALELAGAVDLSRARSALAGLAARHESLRTSFHMNAGDAAMYEQRIADDVIIPLEELPLDGSTPEALLATFTRPFDLSQAPLLRAGAAVAADGLRSVLLFDIHHIIADGTTMNLLLADFAALYSGGTLPPAPVRYRDVSEWMRTRDLADQRAYWLHQFEDFEDRPGIITDVPRPRLKRYDGGQATGLIDTDLRAAVEALAGRHSATPFMVELAALMALLSVHTRQPDVTVGISSAGRVHVDAERVAGMFVNTLAIRGRPGQAASFADLVDQVRATSLAAFDNQNYPFDELVDALGEERHPSRNPLFDVMFVVQNTEATPVKLDGLTWLRTLQGPESAKFDLTFEITPGTDADAIRLTYDASLFRPETATRLVSHYVTLLTGAVGQPDAALTDLPLMSDDELNLVLNDFSGRSAPRVLDPGQTVVSMFTGWAAAQPERVALWGETEQMTYAELDRRTDAVARWLCAAGVTKGDIVAVYCADGVGYGVGAFGVLKAGAAFLPIDASTLPDRVRFMLDDASVKALLLAGAPAPFTVDVPVADVFTLEPGDRSGTLPQVSGGDLAYCIYTSGTTGVPKAALNEHAGLANIVLQGGRWGGGLLRTDVVAHLASPAFDASVLEVIISLGAGATVRCLPPQSNQDPEALTAALKDCTVAYMFPQMVLAVRPKGLRILASVAAPATPDVFEAARDNEILMNGYGPTEATIAATVWWGHSGDPIPARIPIGHPLDGVQVYVLNGSVPCAIGVPGELCVGGLGVGRGYINRPELTAERFVANPFGEGRLYRTGDIVRWRADGEIEFLGREDGQVKVRGFRVELGEVETALRGLPGVRDAVAMAAARAVTGRQGQDDGEAPGFTELVGYVVADPGFDTLAARRALGETLPDYMVPARLIRLDEWPKTATGKIDRRSLRSLPAEPDTQPGALPGLPATREEALLAWIFGEVLGVGPVGVDSSFFELGGNSLRIIEASNLLTSLSGVRLPFRQWVETPTVAGLAAALHEAGSRAGSAAPAAAGGIPAAPARDWYPMSASQQQMYLACQVLGSGLQYNMPMAVEVAGRLDASRVGSALAALLRRHSALRTWFSTGAGAGEAMEFRQHIQAEVALPLEVEDLPADATPESVLSGWVRPFDLERAPLFRVLLALGPDRSIVAFDMHHLISDAVTGQLLLDEFSALYAGDDLPDVRAQYVDWSVWSSTRDLSGQRAFWTNLFPSVPEPSGLVPDYPRSRHVSHGAAVVSSHLPQSFRSAVQTFALEHHGTPFMALLSALMATLARYSGQDDVTIGCPVAGRQHVDCQRTAGLFVNTLALRSFPSPGKTFAALFGEVTQMCGGAFDNQEYPYEELVRTLSARSDSSRNPLFDVTMALETDASSPASLFGLACSSVATGTPAAKFDLTFTVKEVTDGYDVDLVYNSGLFRQDTAERLIGHWMTLLGAAIDSPGATLGDLPMMDATEKAQVLDFSRGPTPQPGKETTAAELFEAVAAALPDHVALVLEDRSVTYAELRTRAHAVAAWLRQAGVVPGDIVAVYSGRGFGYPTGAIGALLAGAAFLPIDCATPDQRVRFEFEDARVKAVLIADAELGFDPGVPTLDVGRDAALVHDAPWTPAEIGPRDLAYCIFTSGTTGAPKGVALEHAGLVNLARHAGRELGVTPADTVLQFASPSFDAAVWELTAALMNGAALRLLPAGANWDPDQVRDALSNCTVTLLPPHLVPYVRPRGLRILCTGGSAAEPETVRLADGNALYVNAYGPTEITVMATAWLHTPEPGAALPPSVPIGRPLPGSQVFVLNGDQLSPLGVPGECCIGGVGLARGYLNRDDLTREKFVSSPFGDGRLYRSGDLVRWLPDGNIEYLGRMDQQVKVRGFRVELGEVEATLAKFPGVRAAAVVAVTGEGDEGDGSAAMELVGYVAADPGLDVGRLRRDLALTLPDYMIPSKLIRVEALPKTVSGKIDKAALPAAERAAETGRSAEDWTARTPEEAVLVAAFEDVLGVRGVGVSDSFFALGGDSIKAIRVVSRVRGTGYDLAVHDVMERRTPAAIALAMTPSTGPLGEQGPVEGVVPLTPIQAAFFAARHPVPQHYNQAFVLTSRQRFDKDAVATALAALAEHHDMLRAVYRQGVQTILPVAEQGITLDYADLPGGDAARFNTDFQAGFDLEHGPLARAVLLRGRTSDHLLLIAHHLIVDTVSWRVLVEDFASAYEQACDGRLPLLPPKTASFKDWSLALQAYGESDSLSDELPFWRQVERDIAEWDVPAPAAPTGPRAPSRVSMRIGRDLVDDLLYEAGKAYDTQINDLLLCTVALAVRRWTGQTKVCVELESHGRAGVSFPGAGRLNVDRTVGWFTTSYPVTVESSPDVGESIRLTMAALRAVPGEGIGYGLLVQAGRLGESPARPRIGFNYLGIEDTLAARDLYRSPLPTGDMIAAENTLGNEITIAGGVVDGELVLNAEYDASSWSEPAVAALCRCFEDALADVVVHCLDIRHTGDAMGLDGEAMEALSALLEGK